MKKFILLFLFSMILTFSAGESYADVEIDKFNFPDEVFRTYIERFDTNRNGVLSDEEMTKVVEINLDRKSDLTSLTGIEYFTSLQTLKINNDYNLSSFNITQNKAIKHLECQNAYLTDLDLSGNPALETLYCHGNKLTSLNLSSNTALETLQCSYNQLITLDLSKNTALKNLYCNYNQLTALILGKNSALETLYCLNNKLTEIDVSDCPNLPALTDDNCDGGVKIIRNNETYEIPSFISINKTNFLDEVFRTYIKQFDLDSDDRLSSEEIAKVIEINLSNKYDLGTTYGIRHFTSLQTLKINNISKLNGIIDLDKIKTLKYLECRSIGWVGDLNFAGNPELEYLYCHVNELRTLNVSQNKNLKVLQCSNNQLTYLDLTQNRALEHLDCRNNKLTEINVSNCPNLLDENIKCDEGVKIIREQSAEKKLTITTETLQNAIIGQPYTVTLTATGETPIQWSKTGSLPKGLELSESGVLSGIPEKAKSYNIKVKASNSYGTDEKILVLHVYEVPVITTEELKEKTFGKNYNMIVKAKGTKPITWSASGLPDGVSIDTNTGKISGLSSVHGSFNVKITAQNYAGSVSKDFVLKINGILPKLAGRLERGNIYESYLSAFTIKKGTYPIKWTLEGNLPNGLTFSEGIFSGMPTQKFSDYVTVTVSNDAGIYSKVVNLVIKGKKPKITTRNLEEATVGEKYLVDFEATGSPIITWSAENLPEGFSMKANELSGTPTTKGKVKFYIIASNSVDFHRKKFTLIINEAADDDEVFETNASSSTKELITENSISFGLERNINSLSQKHLQKLKGYEIAAVLPQISVDVSGLYDLEVNINENVNTNSELIYLAFPKTSEPSEDDEIAEFYDEAGEEISTVPDNHKIILSAWFNKGIVYEPVIAVIADTVKKR